MTAPARSEAPVEGTCDPAFARVREAFRGNFAEHGEIGAALSIRVGGRLVVDLWGGYADAERAAPWRQDTLVNAYSVGKGVLAALTLRLVEQGLVALDRPVAELWPEFAAGGKERVTIEKGAFDRLYSGFIGTVGKLYPLLRVIDSSPYDRSMRRIHNYMKENPAFRDSREGYQEIHFPPLSAWMVFTDGISHSVLTGQHALVTTVLVPLGNCRLPELSPYQVLARSAA